MRKVTEQARGSKPINTSSMASVLVLPQVPVPTALMECDMGLEAETDPLLHKLL